MTEGVDGSDRIFGNDKEVSDEEVGGLKSFSQICSEVGIELK